MVGTLGLNLKLGVYVRTENQSIYYESCTLTLGNKTQKKQEPWEHNILKISTESGNVIAEKAVPNQYAGEHYYPVILSKSCQ
jgi:hypothetical protein